SSEWGRNLDNPKLINPEAQLPVQYKGWSGMWTFAVYDNYPIPMLLGEDLANHAKLAKRVGMVTHSQAKQAFTPIPVPEPSTRAPSILLGTPTEVMEPDPLPTTATAIVDPVPETQPEPVPDPELAKQPAPEPLPVLNPAFPTQSTAPTPEGTTKPALAAAAKPTQKAQPEPEIPHSAPAESRSQSTETIPSPASLPEGPSPSPQSSEELMSPASREQFQAEQEADESLQGAWTAARSNPLPLSSSNRSRFVVERGLLYRETLSGWHQEDWHLQRQLVVPTKYQRIIGLSVYSPGGNDAEWPQGVYYKGNSDGGVKEVNLSMTLGHMQRQQIKELCTRFVTMFSATPGLTEQPYHSIDTGNAHPIRAQLYRVSPQAKTAIEREIQDMLEMGVICPSNSAWESPVVLVPKPDGEIHFCVDFRKLNAVTCPDNYPMPRTDELLEKLGHAQFICTLDLTKGYRQVPLDESTKERSAFITHVGLYEFNVLPFGLQNAPATFQKLVDNLLAGFGESAVAYLDDVAIFSDSWAEHLEHLRKVFERIREVGLTVKARRKGVLVAP
ncbi:unnamed protein product, partial [Caretta caretta]